jgi:lipopolysaccharide exporter
MLNFKFTLFPISFLKTISKVGILTFLGNIVGIILLPVISKYFNQSDFGLFSLFFNLANILIPFISLGLSDAFISVFDEIELKLLLGASLISVVCIVPILVIIVYLLIYFNLFSYGLLPIWTISFFFLELMFVALIMIFQSWSVRKEEYNLIGSANFFLGVLKPVNQLVFGLAKSGFWGLLLSEIVARLFIVFVFIKKFKRIIFESVLLSLPNYFLIVKKYKIFLSRIPSTFLFNIGTALPTLLLTNAFGISEAGSFTFMLTILLIPSAFVQKVIGDVFIGFFSRILKENSYGAIDFFYRFLLMMIGLALVIGLIIYFFSPYIFDVLFDSKWNDSALMIILYLPYFIADFVVAPFGTILNMTNKPYYKLFFDIIRLLGFLFSYLISTHYFEGQSHKLIMLFSISGFFSYCIYLYFINKSLTNYILVNKILSHKS